MNRLPGTVARVETDGEISLVEVDAPGARLTALVLENAASSAWLAPGRAVTAHFKESEVSLATGPEPRVSIRNRLPCRVTAVETGGILAHVSLDFGGSPLHALISAKGALELGLGPGVPVYALIKSTELGLAEGHVPR